jgi:hypothetical protein
MMLLALWPQINMWIARGSHWQGSYVSVQGDEVAYSAYVNALIDGRPRRNDPYSGRDDAPGRPRPESLFSIQFLPAYAIALPARILHTSASTAFIVLIAADALAASLAIFWFLTTLTDDRKLSATGVLVVLCLGTIVASQGQARVLLGMQIIFDDYFPFLRRYEPAVAFSLLFVFFVTLWHAFKKQKQRAVIGWSVAAGLIFAVLVFSYFYLWTAAAAWLACLVLVWLIARPGEWTRVLFVCAIIGAFALAALAPYFILLSHRAADADTGVLMTFSRLPDLLRVPELLSAIVLAVLVVQARRGKLDWRSSRVLFTASLALVSFAVFNQQILTGRSLQPIHYEIFVSNYLSLMAAVLTVAIVVQGRAGASRMLPDRALALVTLAVFGWGIVEATGSTNRNVTQARLRDDAMPVVKWMAAEAKRVGNAGLDGRNPRAIVFASTLPVADSMPTGAPFAQLYIGRLAYFGGSNPEEMRERFYQYMYYSGTGEKELAQAISEGRFSIMAALFGIERVIPALTSDPRPITLDEARTEVRRYSEYIKGFSRERAGHAVLSYVVVPTEAAPDLSNLDRWYERGPGETAGLFTIYRVKLRP